MEVGIEELKTRAIRFSLHDNNRECGRAFLFIIKNNLHELPYGLMEDVFVEERWRGKGLGSQLVDLVINRAKKEGCYKLVATSRVGREKVHELYKKLGFKEHGKEFRMELKNPD